MLESQWSGFYDTLVFAVGCAIGWVIRWMWEDIDEEGEEAEE